MKTLKQMLDDIWNAPGVANPFGKARWKFVHNNCILFVPPRAWYRKPRDGFKF